MDSPPFYLTEVNFYRAIGVPYRLGSRLFKDRILLPDAYLNDVNRPLFLSTPECLEMHARAIRDYRARLLKVQRNVGLVFRGQRGTGQISGKVKEDENGIGIANGLERTPRHPRDYPVLATDDGHNSSQPPCPNFNLGREMRFGTSDRRLSETPYAQPLRD